MSSCDDTVKQLYSSMDRTEVEKAFLLGFKALMTNNTTGFNAAVKRVCQLKQAEIDSMAALENQAASELAQKKTTQQQFSDFIRGRKVGAGKSKRARRRGRGRRRHTRKYYY
jgi:hypothetical protein